MSRIAMAVLMVAGPPAFVVVNHLATDPYFLVPARYGLALGVASVAATLAVLLTSAPVAP